MYKVSFGTIVCTIILIVMLITMIITLAIPAIIELIIDAVNLGISSTTDKILFSMLFIVLFSAILFSTYYCIRSIKYLYLIYSSDFISIKITDNGLILKKQKNDILISYTNIKSITIQEIALVRDTDNINEIIINIANSSLHGFISNGLNFYTRLPYSIDAKMLETKYIRW